MVTHSSGNHGQALAYAAGVRDIECTVVMPDGTSRIKLDAVKAYGGRVVLGPRAAREEIAAREQQASGAVMIHPYEHPDVIAGQGTATLELVEDHPDLDAVIAPVGGGALLSGAAIVLATVTPHARVIGAEPASADAAYQSLQKGRLLPASGRYDSIAEGLLAGLGRTTFAVLSAAGAVVQRVTEHEIIAAARFHLERMKLVVEPSGAAALAALRLQAGDLEGSRVGVIVSGGNTDFSWLARTSHFASGRNVPFVRSRRPQRRPIFAHGPAPAVEREPMPTGDTRHGDEGRSLAELGSSLVEYRCCWRSSPSSRWQASQWSARRRRRNSTASPSNSRTPRFALAPRCWRSCATTSPASRWSKPSIATTVSRGTR